MRNVRIAIEKRTLRSKTKNTTPIMGPGDYQFGDYRRMGLPLEIAIVVVSTPMILWFWPH